jgi:hypothetical protein
MFRIACVLDQVRSPAQEPHLPTSKEKMVQFSSGSMPNRIDWEVFN